MSIRTDLAIEAREMIKDDDVSLKNGIEVNVNKEEELQITHVEITNDDGEKSMGKPIGNYITIEFNNLNDHRDKITEMLSREIKKLINPDNKKDFTTLVVGLGNWNITPDALGPQVVSKLMITKHIFEEAKELVHENMTEVCALSPGVLGLTGIETSKIIKGVVEKIYPDLIIAIDALASRRTERICSTVQLTDTGICPGSGVGNKRKDLSEKTLGVPVIAIGVPTVVDASTIANDTIDIVLDKVIDEAEEGKDFYQMLSEIDKQEKESMIRGLLRPFVGDLLVTPKDVDKNIIDLSTIIATGINMALHPNMTLDEIHSYIN